MVNKIGNNAHLGQKVKTKKRFLLLIVLLFTKATTSSNKNMQTMLYSSSPYVQKC